MPGFFADGQRQVSTQDVPQEVREMMNRYAEQGRRHRFTDGYEVDTRIFY